MWHNIKWNIPVAEDTNGPQNLGFCSADPQGCRESQPLIERTGLKAIKLVVKFPVGKIVGENWNNPISNKNH